MFDRLVIQTPQQYKDALESAFSGGVGLQGRKKLKVKVRDVFIVPDYQAFFAPYIDPDFGRIFKLEYTQHQLRFEAVTVGEMFPHGAKFSYRKFSNDEVVLIEKKPILLCQTEVGRLTGTSS